MAERVMIGSRGSQLALWQANWARDTLKKHHPGLEVEIEVIKTQGDRMAEVPLAQMGGKEVWTKEIETALLDNRIDLAVHSLKDLPTQLPDGLALGAVSAREDVRDALVSRKGETFADLPQKAHIATSSLRRQAQLLHVRSDLVISEIRGNVDTRLRKLESEGLDAIILAAAGLKRLGFADRVTEYLDPDLSVPAPGQAALGIEVRQGDARMADCIAVLNEATSLAAVTAERAMLSALGGGCRVPIGGWARLEDGQFTLTGVVAAPDGSQLIKETMPGDLAEPLALGACVAERLVAHGARQILDLLDNA